MTRLSLAPCADLRVLYAADAARYRNEGCRILDLVTERAFARLYRGCPSRGFLVDGLPIGGIIFDGRRAHIAVLPEYHGRWAWLLKPALEWLFSITPGFMVGIESDNMACLRFMDRCGWSRVRVDERMVTYLVEPRPRRR
jgi:GNAT superfamily N-acetyltransferase